MKKIQLEKEEARKNGYEMGVNKFSDLTEEEFKKILTFSVSEDALKKSSEPNSDTFLGKSLNLQGGKTTGGKTSTTCSFTTPLRTSIDWRTLGAVTSVKNQGSCGSCWAFSSVANIEGQYFRKYNVLNNFSEQHLLSCDTLDSGCNGGLMENAFRYLRDYTNGLALGSTYPYLAYKETCPSTLLTSGVAKVTGYQFAGSRDEGVIANFLVNYGPLAVALDATPLQYYVSGILNPSRCSTSINHAVLQVGYGVSSTGVPFWIVKNSWGTSWGESGYFRIIRNKCKCGINLYVLTALLG